MDNVRSYWGVWGLAVFLVLAMSSLSRAGLVIIDQSAHSDPVAHQITFSITFNQPPDFETTDAQGRPRDAFQYHFDANPAASPDGFVFDGPEVSIIRGPEIRFHHNIPIRASLNETNEDFPHAEGWGEERGAVPFDLAGDQISFTVPWKMLGETDGKFSYHALAFEFGSQTSEVAATSIDLPSPLTAGGVLLAFAGYLRCRKV